MSRRQRAKVLLWIALAGVVALGVRVVCVLRPAAGGAWTPRNIERSKEIGNELAALLVRYRDERGTFPAKLEDLVPLYVDRVPAPVAGDGAWSYRPRAESFALSFGCGKDHYPSCCLGWTEENGSWMLDH